LESRLKVEAVVVGDLAERRFVVTDVKCKFRESLISLGITSLSILVVRFFDGSTFFISFQKAFGSPW
jgi:hypothetical protein